MTTSDDRRHSTTLSLMAAYVAFGVLHELAHLAMASWLLPAQSFTSEGASLPDASSSSKRLSGLLRDVARIVLGRYSLIHLPPASQDDQDSTIRAIRHAGWTFSLSLAVVCHLLHLRARERTESSENNIQRLLTRFGSLSMFLNPAVTFVAYITAIEAIATDLLGFIPVHPSSSSSHFVICFCGNFGVLLLNPSWLSVDGGRTALDILEKMVNVTMMRGMCHSPII